MDPTGQTLGKYRLLEQLGRGGFATVHRALDTSLDREVALKILDPLLMRDQAWTNRFRREARAVARLSHPYIVTIFEVGEAEGRLFLAMQLIPGGSLEDRIAQHGALPWKEIPPIFAQVSDALDYAHGQGVLHRDLKPSNILLGERGAMLSDFGFARLVGESSVSVSLSGGVVGTPNYIAPEVWENRPAGPYTDIYALGCVLYEIVAGKQLFTGDSVAAVMRAHFRPLQLPTEWPAGVPVRLAEVLQAALAKEPGDRYAHAAEMLAELTALAEESLAVPYHALEQALAAQRWDEALALAGQVRAESPSYRNVVALERAALAGREAAARTAQAQVWRKEAKAALAERDREGAELAGRKWLELAPQDPAAQEFLARVRAAPTTPPAPARGIPTTAAPPATHVRCPYCGAINQPSALFCCGCGRALADTAAALAQAAPPTRVPGYCPSCGASNKATARFCSRCGRVLAASASRPPTASAGVGGLTKRPILWPCVVLAMTGSLFGIVAAVGLLSWRNWGRVMTMVIFLVFGVLLLLASIAALAEGEQLVTALVAMIGGAVYLGAYFYLSSARVRAWFRK